MKPKARLGNWLRLAVMLGATALFSAQAPNAAAGVNKPEAELAKAKADRCIKDEDYMIRHHPDLLKHQRDDTMRRGIRSGEYSLKRCMECHSNNAAKHADIKTDCDSCHAFAAVKLDCWDCHARKAVERKPAPVEATQTSPMMSTVQTGGAQ